MTSHYSVYDLRSNLKAFRFRIEMLEAAASTSTAKPDGEIRKCIKEARLEETAILEALGSYGKAQ